MCGRSSSTRSVSASTVRAAAGSASARWARVSSSPTWTVSHGRPWSSSGRSRCARASSARASAGRASWSATRADATCADRARRVVGEARRVDQGLRRRRMSPASSHAPCCAARSASSASASEDLLHSAERLAPLDRRDEVIPGAGRSRRRAHVRRRGPSRAVGTHALSGGELIQRAIRRRPAPARRRLASCAPGAPRPRARCVALPSESGTPEHAPSAIASHVRPPPAVPSRTRTHAP